jgi:hypothetical protein
MGLRETPATPKEPPMTYSDDIRYMSHEQRIAEGFMAAPERKRDEPVMRVCRCGKTVTHTHGRPVPNPWGPGVVTCPRECEPVK